MPYKKKRKRNNYVVLAVPNDEYELPVKVYLSLKEMANDLNITMNRVYNFIYCGYTYRKTNLKYIRVRF